MEDATLAAVPIFVFGVAFGVLAREAGLSPLGALVMSATTFAGAAQFAVVSVTSDGGSWLAAAVAGATLNLRYIALGVSAAPAFARLRVPLRLLGAQLMVDESWAIAQRGGRVALARLLGAGVLLYVAWVGGTALGLLAPEAVDPEALGLDAVLPAFFLLLLRPYLDTPRSRATAITAAAVTIGASLLLPAGLPLLVGGAVAVLVFRPRPPAEAPR